MGHSAVQPPMLFGHAVIELVLFCKKQLLLFGTI